ncbi:MAG: hypothetical protein K0Q66_54 [Chitinophagaceae bacterium]|jgi:hypothetical protein|nr:hypothetical protein [Chitinophagaceae bacterium]
MKQFMKLCLLVIAVAAVLTACEKAESLALFGTGTAPVLSASSSSIAPVAADSNNVALTLSWTNPKHATDSANQKFTIEIDSSGKNFSNPYTTVVTGSLSKSFIAKELNEMLLSKGYAFNVPVGMDVKVTSSYLNNNERLSSNVLKIMMTPYKIPPKVALPASNRLFIVGSATQGGWTNPVPVPSQELTRIDETTWGGIFQLNGGQFYLLLPVNGDWSNKYSVANNSIAGLSAGGDFGYNLAQDFPSPSTSGLYKIIVDFQTGKFTVTPFTQQHGLPADLFIVGGATPGGWSNPVPVPSQKFTRLTSTKFELASVALTAGQMYLLLPENGNWGKKYGVADNTAAGIKLGATLVPEGQDIPSPDVSGNYKITVDFLTNKYTLVKL